jgi:hypothetical protein
MNRFFRAYLFASLVLDLVFVLPRDASGACLTLQDAQDKYSGFDLHWWGPQHCWFAPRARHGKIDGPWQADRQKYLEEKPAPLPTDLNSNRASSEPKVLYFPAVSSALRVVPPYLMRREAAERWPSMDVDRAEQFAIWNYRIGGQF